MERLTAFDGEFWVHKNFPPVAEDTIDEFVDCVKELAARLAAIEDILGDDYDLERLRELVEADRLIGKTVYYPYAGKILEKRVSQFIIYDEQRANLPPKESWFCIDNDESETFDFKDIGKTIFLTREAASAALKGEQDG